MRQVNVNRSPDDFRESQPSRLAKGVELFNVMLWEKQGGSFHVRMIYTAKEYTLSIPIFDFFNWPVSYLGFVPFQKRLQVAFAYAGYVSHANDLQSPLRTPAPESAARNREHLLNVF